MKKCEMSKNNYINRQRNKTVKAKTELYLTTNCPSLSSVFASSFLGPDSTEWCRRQNWPWLGSLEDRRQQSRCHPVNQTRLWSVLVKIYKSVKNRGPGTGQIGRMWRLFCLPGLTTWRKVLLIKNYSSKRFCPRVKTVCMISFSAWVPRAASHCRVMRCQETLFSPNHGYDDRRAYLTIIPRARVGCEIIDSQRGV